jgi:murein DD-endopeptidase MepM/ murein hydrolase activator NlpD
VAEIARQATAPDVFFDGKRVTVYRSTQHWLALVGIPLSAQAGEASLDVIPKENSASQQVRFDIKEKEYEAQYITLPTQRHVTLSEENLKRHQGERIRSQKALASWNTDILPFEQRMQWPVTGRISAVFGLKRFFNQQPRQPHSGIDIAAPTGTPIVAPLKGVVVETGEFFFNGNTLFIDHGHGIVTLYCHLDRTDVVTGQTVEQGEQIGTVGATGRVTGPHLHWSVSVNGIMVDPLLFTGPMPEASFSPPQTPPAN